MVEPKKIECKKLGGKRAALEAPPFPGPIGQMVFENISSDAWHDWNEVQIKIINEERLDLSEQLAQERLFGAMLSYLGLKDEHN